MHVEDNRSPPSKLFTHILWVLLCNFVSSIEPYPVFMRRHHGSMPLHPEPHKGVLGLPNLGSPRRPFPAKIELLQTCLRHL